MTMLRYADTKKPEFRVPVVTFKPPQMKLETLLALSDADCVRMGKELGEMYAAGIQKERDRRLMHLKQDVLRMKH